MSHHLQESAGSALALHPQNPVPPPINEDGSTSQHAPGSAVACHVCGSNMRCFLNVSCICAMSHHLQESARKNTQKKSKSSSSRHIICEHNRRRSICKECNGGSVCSHGKQRIWCGDCGGKARCDHGKQRSKCLECGGKGLCPHSKFRYPCVDISKHIIAATPLTTEKRQCACENRTNPRFACIGVHPFCIRINTSLIALGTWHLDRHAVSGPSIVLPSQTCNARTAAQHVPQQCYKQKQ
jgi:hypothetical protein